MSYQQPFRWHYPAYDDTNFQIRGRTLFFILVLFAVILLVGLIFLYARWICRVRHTSTMENETTSSAASLAAHAPVPTPRGLDAAAINSLPIELHACLSRAAAAEDDECCICLSAFADGDKVKVLPLCRHRFHCECVDKWLTTHSSCPLCRDSIIESPV